MLIDREDVKILLLDRLINARSSNEEVLLREILHDVNRIPPADAQPEKKEEKK